MHTACVAAAVDALAEAATEARDVNAVALVQNIAQLFAENVSEYGAAALPVLCALARAGGGRALRRLAEDGPTRLVMACAEQAGVVPPVAESADPAGEKLVRLAEKASVADAVALFCALAQLGGREPALSAALSRHLADHYERLLPAHLPALARALNGPLGRGDSPEDFVLMHALSRRGAALMQELDGPSVVALLQVFGRYDIFDEEFLDAASAHLKESTSTLAASQLGDAMYAFGYLQVRDPEQLDALCDAFRPKVEKIGEGDLVRFMRGLVRLRHCNEAFLKACQPVIESQMWDMSAVTITNLINCLSLFETTTEEFFNSLLHCATARSQRLTPSSIQHVLTALCRQHGRLPRVTQRNALERICAQLASPIVAPLLTPLQAVASLTALAKLQHQDHAAAAVLVSVLAGRGADVLWTWAPSAYFYAHGRARPGGLFDEAACGETLARAIESSHCVEVLHSLHRLDLHSALASRLTVVLCRRLVPQLHELRAREVLIVARALAESRLPGPPPEADIAVGAACNLTAANERERPETFPASWRERIVDTCFENLRRHEHFLETSWNTLLPFKLLCMEVDADTYGSRRLSEVLSPSLLSFVERLRSLTRAECEAHRMRAQKTEEDEDVGAAGSATEPTPGGATIPAAIAGPAVQDFAGHRLILGGCIGEFTVDLLVEPVGAGLGADRGCESTGRLAAL